MIHTVYLDDTHVNGRKLLKEIRRYKRGVRFENPAINGITPDGYITSEEFRKLAISKVNKFCDENGIL